MVVAVASIKLRTDDTVANVNVKERRPAAADETNEIIFVVQQRTFHILEREFWACELLKTVL